VVQQRFSRGSAEVQRYSLAERGAEVQVHEVQVHEVQVHEVQSRCRGTTTEVQR